MIVRRLEKLGDPCLKQVMTAITTEATASEYINRNRQAILDESASPALLQEMLRISLAIIHHERNNP